MATAQAARARRRGVADVLDPLKDDHARLRNAYRQFRRLNADEGPQACEHLVAEVLDELTVHAALEAEFVYPAARGAVDDALLDEAEVAHASMHREIQTLRRMAPTDDQYAARFSVLCEHALYHAEEEEAELFPQLEHAGMDWHALAQEVDDRRAGLLRDPEAEIDTESGPNESGPTGAAAHAARGRESHDHGVG